MDTISPEELQQINDMFDAFNKRIDALIKTMDEGFDRLDARFDRLDRSFDRHVSSNRQTYRRDLQPFVLRESRRSDGSIFPSLSQ